ncbi:MAG: hypothetical protein MUF64_11835 [Polyangiaceae bacterium]|nr:hypothetical protein [Polyangiaceae bacterium]
MRVSSLSLLLLAGCTTPPAPIQPEPPPAASPRAPPEASEAPAPASPPAPRPAPLPVSAEEARQRVAELPEVQALSQQSTFRQDRERKVKLKVWVRREAIAGCAPPGCKHEVEAGDEEDPPDGPGALSFTVDAHQGGLEVQLRNDDGVAQGFAPYTPWSELQKRRERYLDLLFSLPDVRAYDAMLRRLSRGKVWMTVRIEETPTLGCAEGAPDCRWQYYVGERHDDHTVRGSTYEIDDVSGKIWRTDLAGRRTPVAAPAGKKPRR